MSEYLAQDQTESDTVSDAEDILSTSLQTLYGLSPITQSSAGSVFVYTIKSTKSVLDLPNTDQLTVTLRTPDTLSANWSLHASSIWVSALYLADHLENLQLTSGLRILELGAGAGLPGILISKVYADVQVTVSDYPDEKLIRTLSENVQRNGVSERCRAVPYAWGSDISSVARIEPSNDSDSLFDLVIAADTLWNSELHCRFIDALHMTLRKTPHARVHLVAGFHTGRYAVQSFLIAVQEAGFAIDKAVEREVSGDAQRPWDVAWAEGEDEKERRRWVIWIVLKWRYTELE